MTVGILEFKNMTERSVSVLGSNCLVCVAAPDCRAIEHLDACERFWMTPSVAGRGQQWRRTIKEAMFEFVVEVQKEGMKQNVCKQFCGRKTSCDLINWTATKGFFQQALQVSYLSMCKSYDRIESDDTDEFSGFCYWSL